MNTQLSQQINRLADDTLSPSASGGVPADDSQSQSSSFNLGGSSQSLNNDNVADNSLPQMIDPYEQLRARTQTAASTPSPTPTLDTPEQSPQEQSTPQIKVGDGNTMQHKTSDVLNANTHQSKQKPDDQEDEVISEIEELQDKVDSTHLPGDLRERANRSIDRLRRMAKRGSYTGEFETVEKYIYWITSVPWGRYSADNLDVHNAKEIMDGSHYGMETVKNLVLDYLAVMQLQQRSNGYVDPSEKVDDSSSIDMAVLRGSSANAPVMLFVGLQGVGKTSIAKSIATSMGREFQRVAVGAIGSVQALRGQSKAFLDAEPGGIIKALTRSGSMNPVILLDEIDKASGNSGLLNDIMAALLEILDPEQNNTFMDHYVDFPVDLSKVFFICTANNLGSLSAALLDRMEVIRFTSYSDEEKTYIARNYSMPKVVKNSGIDPSQISIEEDVWPILVRPVGFDAGLRQLERNIATMVRAAARKIIDGSPTPIQITSANIREFVLPDQGPMS